jgi:radical SAM protein with 4Fe4S-binding SPASM domain
MVVESGARQWGLHLVVPEGRAASRPELFLSTRQLQRLLRFAGARRQCFPVTMADEIGYCGSWEPLLRDGPFRCGAGRAQCVVLPDGELVPCTTMDRTASAGNIRRRTLRELWEHGFAELRRPPPAVGECARCAHALACGQGCWLQRRHHAQCFRRAWRLPRAARAAGLAVSLSLAAAGVGGPGTAGAQVRIPPVYASTQMEELQQQIILWYAGQAGGARAPSADTVKRLQTHLAGDPGAAYFLAFVSGQRPRQIEAKRAQMARALTTKQRSLCLVGLMWRDLTEWALDGPRPERRSPAEVKALRDAVTLVGRTAESWRLEIFRGKLDPFLRRPSGYRHFFMSKAGPRPHLRTHSGLAAKRGWTRPGLTEKLLAEHPYGETMALALRARIGAGLQVGRRGKIAPFDGKLGPFDLLLVPAQGLSPTVTTQTDGQTLRIALPRGAALSHGDVLRLAFEQNTDTLTKLAARDRMPVSPWVLPVLRAKARGSGPDADAARWQLANLYLF